jgi:hypothetical protein
VDYLPKPIAEHLAQWFNYRQAAVYGQLANSLLDRLKLRTMRLSGLSPTGCLEFLSRTDTPKWLAWQKKPQVALCFFNPEFGQLLAEGEVLLKTVKTEAAYLNSYWQALPKRIQEIYTGEEAEAVPENFGLITVIPHFGESVELSKEAYLSSLRTVYQRQDKDWVQQRIKVTS